MLRAGPNEVLLLPCRAKQLHPVNTFAAFVVHGKGSTHLSVSRRHDVSAVAGAFEPALHCRVGLHLARCDVLADGAPCIAGTAGTLGHAAAIAAGGAEVVVARMSSAWPMATSCSVSLSRTGRTAAKAWLTQLRGRARAVCIRASRMLVRRVRLGARGRRDDLRFAIGTDKT